MNWVLFWTIQNRKHDLEFQSGKFKESAVINGKKFNTIPKAA